MGAGFGGAERLGRFAPAAALAQAKIQNDLAGNSQEKRPRKRAVACIPNFKKKVARLTGLEPATPGVTGRYSNQLSYNRAYGLFMVPAR